MERTGVIMTPTTDLREIRKRAESGMMTAREAMVVFNIVDRMSSVIDMALEFQGERIPSGVLMVMEQVRREAK